MEDINFKREPNPVEKMLHEMVNKKKNKSNGQAENKKHKKEKIIKKKFVRISGFVSNGYICEMVINSQKKYSGFVLFHSTTNHLTYENQIEQGNKIYIPDKGDNLVIGNRLKIPKLAQKYGSLYKLKGDLREYLNKYVDIKDDLDKEIVITYILLTWVYDRFTAIPYLRIIGDYGTGKSRLLKVLTVCYRSLYTSGMDSTATIFRLIDRYGCTLLIDEAEFSNKAERNDDIKAILRFGKDSDGVVLRCDPNTFEVIGFKVFGPKILGSRRSTGDDALESRIISIGMQETKSENIPLFLDKEEFSKDSDLIRSKLLDYRLKNYYKIDTNAYKKYIEAGVFKRLNEMMAPLICIRPDDKDFIEGLIFRAREKHGQILEDKSMSLDASIISEIYVQHFEPNHGNPLVQRITDSINEKLKNKTYHSRFIGGIIRDNFKLTTRHTRGGNEVIYEEDKIMRLIKEYNLMEILDIKGHEEIHQRVERWREAKRQKNVTE